MREVVTALPPPPFRPEKALSSAFDKDRSLIRWEAQSAEMLWQGMPHTFSV
jgi:hypothetical protein